ncbi:hypothetical protein QJS10_CPB13g00663 [Acorus calamus]|uniref:Uncharacterized protein n=1 Tax=Acorus calamus TaxID=4465 RepID=A0AAV9DGD3_ACOCL|nr:hypothetical protein QJS10_CPB13g00663 [Acorus calamus]
MGSSFPWRFIVWLILGLLALNGLVSGCEARMSFPKQTEVAHLHHVSGDDVMGFGEIKRINPQLPPSPMANCPQVDTWQKVIRQWKISPTDVPIFPLPECISRMGKTD